MVFCFHCRHSSPPESVHCANCGRSLAIEQQPAMDGDDEALRAEEEPQSPGPRHTVAYEQLQQLCAASVQNLLADDAYRSLLEELVAYLDGQQARFTRLETPESGAFDDALATMHAGLTAMRDACQTALAIEPPLTEAAAAEILSQAVDADTRIAEATEMLDRIA